MRFYYLDNNTDALGSYVCDLQSWFIGYEIYIRKKSAFAFHMNGLGWLGGILN